MIIVKPSVEIIDNLDNEAILNKLELCGRNCYKSEGRITENSASEFIRRLTLNKHESVMEHFSFTVRFICDRGVSHEIVRHRLASYSQESTRYCNYAKEDFGSEITVVKPFYLTEETPAYKFWELAMICAETEYFNMLDAGCTAQEARAVLPNSLKTDLIMTANLREWRHFIIMRGAPAAHPQMKELIVLFRQELSKVLGPVLFDYLTR